MMKARQASHSSKSGELEFAGEVADEFPLVTDPSAVSDRVREGYSSVGHLLDSEDAIALLADALCLDCPIVGISRGFSATTGYTREHVLGHNCRMLLHGIPEVSISKSVRKNLRDFCRMCRKRNLDLISEVTALQPNARSDGSQYMNFFMVGRVMIRRHPYLLGVQRVVGEGIFVKLNGAVLEQVTEQSRSTFKRLERSLLSLQEALSELPWVWGCPGADDAAPPTAPGFSWFTERLQDHCIIANMELTALRREPQELATNCLVFGNRPMKHTAEGLFFAVRVDDAVATFDGLPLIGFTRRKPMDHPDLYPPVCRCLGLSVLVGACGEAFARDQQEHFRIGFKPPPQSEVQSWSLQPDLPPHKRRPPAAVQPGDVFGCMYTRRGHIQLWRNGELLLDFDVGRPVDDAEDYYAVADVCLSASSLTILPMTSPREDLYRDAAPVPTPDAAPPAGHQDHHGMGREPMAASSASSSSSPDNIDAMVSDVVNNALVRRAIRTVVAECQFCVTVADPKGHDIPLIAVSEMFESMTGFKRSEILGVNCRFLNQGCPISPKDLMALRAASENGSPFTALLPNRKKSGEIFINLLDLRGLIIAQHTETNEALWYLVGIQADVTGLAESNIPEDHLAELQRVATMIRGKLRKELSLLAADGAERCERQLTSSSCSSHHADAPGGLASWRLLDVPTWMGSGPKNQSPAPESCARSAKTGEAALAPCGGLAERSFRSAEGSVVRVGGSPAGLLLMGALALFAGLLFGRCTRRV